MCVGRRFAEIELHTLLAKVGISRRAAFFSYPLNPSNLPHLIPGKQIFRKYQVSYSSGEFVYRVNSTYIPQSPLNFKLTLRDE